MQAASFQVKSCKDSGCTVLILNFTSSLYDHRTQILIVEIFVGKTCNSYRTIFRALWVSNNCLALALASSGKKYCRSHLTIFFT